MAEPPTHQPTTLYQPQYTTMQRPDPQNMIVCVNYQTDNPGNFISIQFPLRTCFLKPSLVKPYQENAIDITANFELLRFRINKKMHVNLPNDKHELTWRMTELNQYGTVVDDESFWAAIMDHCNMGRNTVLLHVLKKKPIKFPNGEPQLVIY